MKWLRVMLFVWGITLAVGLTTQVGAAQTYTISGYVRNALGQAIAGVTISGLPGNPVTDTNGYYSATVDVNWAGTVTPQKTGYVFNPSTKQYSGVVSNHTGEDYEAKYHTSWVFIYYMSAAPQHPKEDPKGLDAFIFNKFASIAQAGNNNARQAYMLWDRPLSSEEDRVYRVTDESDPSKYIHGKTYWTAQDIGLSKAEMDTGDVNTLNAFVNFVLKLHDADHYALIIFDHGGGVWPTVVSSSVPQSDATSGPKGVVFDNYGSDYLSIRELGEGASHLSALLGRKFEILYLDACLMQMIEVVYEVREYCKLVIGSENEGWAQSSEYSYLSQVTTNTTAAQLAYLGIDGQGAHSIAKSYFDYVKKLGATISVLDTSQADTVHTRIRNLAQTMINHMNEIKDDIKQIRDVTQKFAWFNIGHTDDVSNVYVDLKDLCRKIVAQISVPEVTTAAQAVVDAIGETGGNFIKYEAHQNGQGYFEENGKIFSYNYNFDTGTYGVSIFFPPNTSSNLYYNYINASSTPSNLKFCKAGDQDSLWDEFLSALLVSSGIDVGLVIDKSGSMDTSNKLPMAKEAAKYFINASQVGDQLAISAFASSGQLVASLTKITNEDPSDSVKVGLKNAVEGLSAGGSTNFGAGLQIVYDQLNSSPLTQRKFAVLMSDGHNNTGTYDAQVQAFHNKGWPIYTIAFGSDADKDTLRKIAEDTNGIYYPPGTNLTTLYDLIQADMSGKSVLTVRQWLVQQGQTIISALPPIASGTTYVRFLLNWGGSDVDLVLIRPDGTEIDPYSAVYDPNVGYHKSTTYAYYTVNNPMPGSWSVKILGTNLPSPEIVTLSATATLPVVCALYGYQATYSLNDVIPIRVQVREQDNTPITGATVEVEVTQPGGTAQTLPLYDDGAHNDELRNDGIYGNQFTDTSVEGFYGLNISISGTYSGGAFTQGIVTTVLVGTPQISTALNWSDNFEYPDQSAMEAAGWSLNGQWCLVNETDMTRWHYPGLTPFPSSTHAAYFGDPSTGSYAGTATIPQSVISPQARAERARLQPKQAGHPYGELTSPDIPVDGQSAVEVSFNFFREVECYEQGAYDKTYMQVSFDGGAWQTVWSVDSRDCSIPKTWIPINLNGIPIQQPPSAIVAVPNGADTMKVRFVFDAVDNVGNNYLGWLIDNVKVTSAGAAGLRIDPQALPEGIVNQAYTTTVTALGGTPPYAWRVMSKPQWLTVNANGSTCTLSGTPTDAGSYQLCLRLSDARGQTVDQCYNIVIEYSITNGTLFFDDFEGGQAQPWAASGLWHLAENLNCLSPPYASPTHAYYYGRDATCNYVTPSGANTGHLISPAIDVSGLTGGSEITIGWKYWREVESYPKDHYDKTWVEVSFDGTNWQQIWYEDSQDPSENGWQLVEIPGIAVPAGASALHIRFSFDTVDGCANSYTGWLIDDVKAIQQVSGVPALQITTACPLPNGAEDTPYGPVQLKVQGGIAPYTWTASGLPQNITCSPKGVLSGIPAIGTAGVHSVTLKVEDAVGNTTSKTCDLTVEQGSVCPCTLLTEDFTDATKWTKTGLWHISTSLPCIDCENLTGDYAYFGQDETCNYDTGARVVGALSSPMIDIPECVQKIAVEFDSFRSVESNSKFYDKTWVEISFDGNTWKTLWYKDSAQASPACKHVQVGCNVPAGAKHAWLRFRFDSVDNIYNNFPGWAIDNIQVLNSDCVNGFNPDATTKEIHPEAFPRNLEDLVSVLNIPNPVRDVNTTTFSVRGIGIEAIKIQIFDINENLVYEEEVPGNKLEWHTVNNYGEYLANGVYFYRAFVKIDGKWITTKFQKLVILR